MENTEDKKPEINIDTIKSTIFSVIAFCFIGMAFGYMFGNGNGYKDGQIDAIHGKIRYHMVTKLDSTKTWEEIK